MSKAVSYIVMYYYWY